MIPEVLRQVSVLRELGDQAVAWLGVFAARDPGERIEDLDDAGLPLQQVPEVGLTVPRQDVPTNLQAQLGVV